MAGDDLFIISPATGKRETFCWVPCKDGEIKEDNSEIVDIISWILDDVDELTNDQELLNILQNVDRSSYSSVSSLCSSYNKSVTKLLNKWNDCDIKPAFLNRRASRPHVQFILYQCYNRAVAEPDRLNQYPPFSPQVYGETSFELISQMIDTVKISADESFIDLGSGVGQVVLQVAACSNAKVCYGIEMAEYPATCACKLDSEFRYWMEFYGKPFRPYVLERGDFLSAEYQERITSAGVLFANNFAFGPEVDHQLKQRFANLKEGARIISSKAFCPLNFRITDRNLGDIGSIMHVSCLNPIQDAVSWTDKPFSYYVHTIDRSLLERYFSRLKNPKLKDEVEPVRRDRKGRVISENASKETHQVHSNGHTNGSAKYPLTATVSECMTNGVHGGGGARPRPRRSKSLEILSGRPLSKPSRLNARNSRTKSHHAKSKSYRQARDRISHRDRTKRSLSTKQALTRTPKSRSALRTDSPIGDRLAATIPFEASDSSDGMVRSVSCSNFVTRTASVSGQTTPTGSTSVSSTAFTNDECVTSCGSGLEPDRFSSSTFATDRTIGAAGSCTPSFTAAGMLRSSSFNSTYAESGHSNSGVRHPPRISNSLSSSKLLDSDKKTSLCSADSEDTSVANRRAVRKCRQFAGSHDASYRNTASASKASVMASSSNSGAGRLRARGPVLKPNFRNTSRHRHVKSHPANRTVNQGSQSLDLLHHATLSQISESPKPGTTGIPYNDPDFSAYTCHYQANELRTLAAAKRHASATHGDPHVGHSNEPVPLALTQFLELSKRMFMDHMATVRSPGYTTHIRSQLEREQARHAELVELTRTTEQTIGKLHADGTELLRRFTKRLGILITTPSAFFAQARKLIKHHHALESKIAEFRSQIAELSAANQDLVRRHQAEAARLLSTASHSLTSPDALHTNPPKSSLAGHSSGGRMVKTSAHLSESPILIRTLTTDIPPPPLPPPSLTKVHMSVHKNPPALTRYIQPSPAPNARHPHSIPLLSPQFSSPANNNNNNDHPPVLFPLDERLTPSSIPPPPPLLPMRTMPLRNTDSSAPPLCATYASTLDQRPGGQHSVSSNGGGGGTERQRQHPKSVHSSLQDLIVSEFSCDSTAKAFNHSDSRSTPHQLKLPPRKRSWDSSDLHTTSPHKYPRTTESSPESSRNPDSTHPSPPTLSPMEPRLTPSTADSDFVNPGSKLAMGCGPTRFHNSSPQQPPPPLLYTHEPQCRSAPMLDMNQRAPPLSTMPLVLAQASGQ